MAGGPRFFVPPSRLPVARKAGVLVLFRRPQLLSASVGKSSESVGNRDSRFPANIATPRHHPVWARHAPSGHHETTLGDCHSHRRPSTSSPLNGLHPSACQPFSDTNPTLQSTSPKAGKACFCRIFLGLGSLLRTFVQYSLSFFIILALLILLFPLLSFFHP